MHCPREHNQFYLNMNPSVQRVVGLSTGPDSHQEWCARVENFDRSEIHKHPAQAIQMEQTNEQIKEDME